MSYHHASHLMAIQKTYRREVIGNAIGVLSEVQFDTIAFSGLSGALVAPSLADAMDKEIICVRKDQDTDNHSGLRVEGYSMAKRYIIVDDLISTGKTLTRIIREMKNFAPKALYLGYYAYLQSGAKFHPSGEEINTFWGRVETPAIDIAALNPNSFPL